MYTNSEITVSFRIICNNGNGLYHWIIEAPDCEPKVGVKWFKTYKACMLDLSKEIARAIDSMPITFTIPAK